MLDIRDSIENFAFSADCPIHQPARMMGSNGINDVKAHYVMMEDSVMSSFEMLADETGSTCRRF